MVRSPTPDILKEAKTTRLYKKTRAMNEALLLGSLRQHELTEVADRANAQLKVEIGERKRAEEALRASELSYRRLFEAAKDGILILEAESGRITDVNPFLTNLLDFSHEELVGKPIWELGPFKDIVSNKAKLAQLQQQGYVRYENLPLETRDGRKIAVEFVSNVYQAGDRDVIQCNIRDITETKQAEIKLAASESHLRAIINNEPECVKLIAADGSLLEMNPAGLRMIEADSFQQVENHCIYPFVVPEHRQAFKELNESVFAGGSGKLEFQIIGLKGGRRWLETHASPLRDIAGKVTALLAVTRDVTEHKQAEKMSIQLAAIVEFSDDAIIGKDLDGVIQSWNTGAEKIFGYSAGEMVGGSITTLIPAERLEEEDHILEKIRRGESVLHFETVRQAKNGRRIDVSITLSPIKDSTGRIVGASKVARDVSERKVAEDEIRRLNAELEQRVIERTAQLQAANEELEAFSYSVSHDLRAPLRHVMGFVDLLQKDAGSSLSEEGLRHLKTISESAKRMGTLIDDLLAFSRIARAEMKKAEVNLDQLVQETLGDFQPETKERKIVWHIHPLPVVLADRALIRLVLVNLISNALKFTSRRDEARIEIGSLESDERHVPGDMLDEHALHATRQSSHTIFIRDNGAGFDPRYADKLFGVFQRLHSTDEFEGTGIGLANVQRIIQRHGGRVWAEGAEDKGATFFFSIPKHIGGRNGQ